MEEEEEVIELYFEVEEEDLEEDGLPSKLFLLKKISELLDIVETQEQDLGALEYIALLEAMGFEGECRGVFN